MQIAHNPDTGEYLFTDTNADGEHYDDDLALTDSLIFGKVTDITREGDRVTFRYVYEWDETGDDAQTISVNTSDLLMDSAVVGNGGISMQILRGEEVPFEKELTEAFRKTRTVTVHWGEAGDKAYTLPADWAFSAGYFEDLTVYSDAAMKSEFPQPIPGDGKDYEVWVKENEYEPAPDEAEPDPIEKYIGNWVSESEASALKVSSDGSFEYEMGGDAWFGTLVWTTEEKGLWASGGRYELVLTDGSTLQGDTFVTVDDDGMLTFAQGGGAERYHRYCLIRADYAGDSLPDCLEFTADRGEYAVKVLLTPEKPVKDFLFFSIKQETAADGSVGMSTVDLYKLADFTPEKPLLVTMTFGEAFPSYGFTYRGEDGVFRTYGIVQSGMDGSVIVTRTVIAMG